MPIVLLGAAGTGTSFAIASRLRANWGSKLKLIVTDVVEEMLVTTSLLADKFYKVPYANDPSFEHVLIDILQREGVQTYIPVLNSEIVLASRLRRLTSLKDIDFWSSDVHALCADKIAADRWLKDIGVRTPASAAAADFNDTDILWFCKPRDSVGSRGTHVMTGQQIQQLTKNEQEALIIQELCEGPEITVDSFWDTSRRAGYVYCRERIEVKSGVCTKARIFSDPELTIFAERIATGLQQRGTICFQAMKAKSGWAVTDLNFRSGAGTAMTCSAGFDVIAAAFACRNGEDFTQYVRPLRTDEEFYVTRQYAEFVMRHAG